MIVYGVAYLLLTLLIQQASSSNAPPTIELLSKQLKVSPTEGTLWKQLGKLQLDSCEYAEAARIFRTGSRLCPGDAGLKHHVQVWNAFHGEINKEIPLEIPALKRPFTDEMFLSLDVPQVPDPVRLWKGQIASDDRKLLLHASREPILSREACQYLINAAKQVAETRGWTKNRHVQAPTCDIPAHDLPLPAQAWTRQAFHNVLFPLIQEAFGEQLDLNNLCIQDCFVVRYDGEQDTHGPGFAHLKPHEDESLISLTIALNDMDEYEGGGLYIASTQDLLNGPAGTVLCFPGGLVHGGYPVTKGTRWILTVFLYCDSNRSGKPAGYTLDNLKMNDE
jgi:predicted 2-oxoglutarate/Fe(II)-dependent dioxygenase YbiX